MPFTDLDKIFWFRTALGVIGGTASELLTGCQVLIPPVAGGSACVGGLAPDYQTGIILGMFLFIISYYFLKMTIGKKFPKDEQRKIYTTGVGSFALLFVFSWVLLFTLGVHYLNF